MRHRVSNRPKARTYPDDKAASAAFRRRRRRMMRWLRAGLRRWAARRRQRAVEREIEAERGERADPKWAGDDITTGLGAPPTCTGAGVPQELLRPGPREASIWCRYGYCLTRSVIVRDTPDTRTPTWWRQRVAGAFSLTLHPFGLAGVKGDPTRGHREMVSLGTWPGTGHLPDLPVGEPPAEVELQGTTRRVRAALSAHSRGAGTPVYVVNPAAWMLLTPTRQATFPREIEAHFPGRKPVRLVHAGQSVDSGMQKYQEPPK